ncbi:MAG: hypothetical protein ABJN34_10010 [Litoreibacter sp.]|uniref:hypothetical protein n=1 Tax=Litoreibacter sp. TaxID=1969459 RepID=UPI003298551B
MSANTGTYVSGMGHAAFILYLMVGGFFVSRETDLDVQVSNVSIISGEEFEAIEAQSKGSPELPPAPDAPAEVEEPAPATEAETPVEPEPEPAPAVEPDPTPAPEPDPEPTPEPAPVEPAPAEPDPVEPEPVETPVEPEQPDAPEVDGTPGATIISPNARPVPRPAVRISDTVVEEPEPEVEVAGETQAETAPAPDPAPVEETQEETAPEPQTTEIVTEADEPSDAAPTKSARPGRKPTPPARPATQTAETTTPSLADTIKRAVEVANETQTVDDNVNPGGGTGAPITRQEKGTFILGIQKCWNVGALGTDALAVSVVVGFQMEQDATPIVGSIKLISSKGGSGDAVNRAYEAARRAIIRCGANGYPLPLDKYNQWREVQVSFNATNKEIR